MSTFQEVSACVSKGIHEVIERVETFRSQEPWTHLEGEQRINALPTLADLACTLALTPSPQGGLCRRMLESAALHGYTRRDQGLPDAILLRELGLVRQAIWLDLHERYGAQAADAIAEVILRIDRAFTLAYQGSLRGYFRAEFERLGSWPDAILSLEPEWTVPRIPSTDAGTRAPDRWSVRRRYEKRRLQRYRRAREDAGAAKLPQLPNTLG